MRRFGTEGPGSSRLTLASILIGLLLSLGGIFGAAVYFPGVYNHLPLLKGDKKKKGGASTEVGR